MTRATSLPSPEPTKAAPGLSICARRDEDWVWGLLGFMGVYLGFIGAYWGLLGFIGVYLGFIGAYWGLLGFRVWGCRVQGLGYRV